MINPNTLNTALLIAGGLLLLSVAFYIVHQTGYQAGTQHRTKKDETVLIGSVYLERSEDGSPWPRPRGRISAIPREVKDGWVLYDWRYKNSINKNERLRIDTFLSCYTKEDPTYRD